MKKNRENAKNDFINFLKDIKNEVYLKKLLPEYDFQENLNLAAWYPT